ncbi:MAG: deoxyribonuclease V [Gammaproteobacteria bacterium]
MTPPSLTLAHRHRWAVSPRRAIAIQESLRGRVIARRGPESIATVAGIDVGFEDAGAVTRAAVVVLSFPGLVPLDWALARCPTRFPYVPGLLSFRELPAVLAALRRLRRLPDLLICDGQGLAHPRRFGIACHLGVLLDRPAIGVAKSLLVGTHATLPARRGAWRALRDRDQTVGVALRTRSDVAPVYVSIGHRMDLAGARRIVLACAPHYRLPETTRFAHALASSGTPPAASRRP